MLNILLNSVFMFKSNYYLDTIISENVSEAILVKTLLILKSFF